MPPSDRITGASDALLYGLTGRSRQGLEDAAAAGFGALDPARGARQDRAVHAVASENMARRFGAPVATAVGDIREFGQGVGSLLRGRGFFGQEGFDGADQQANDAGVARAGDRTTVPPLPDTSSVTTETADFRVDPSVTNPVYAIPSFLTVPTLPEKPSTFDDAFDDFRSGDGDRGGYSIPDPISPGDQLPSDIGPPGSVDTGTYDNREGLPEFDGNGNCVANCGPAPESDINPAALTPEEQAIVDNHREENLRDIYGQDPVLQHLLGGMGGGGGGSTQSFFAF